MPMYAVQCSNPNCAATEVYASVGDVVENPHDGGYAGATVPCECGQRTAIKPGGFIIDEFAFGGQVGSVRVGSRREALAVERAGNLMRIPPDVARRAARDMIDRNNEKVLATDRENRGRR